MKVSVTVAIYPSDRPNQSMPVARYEERVETIPEAKAAARRMAALAVSAIAVEAVKQKVVL